MLSDLAVLHSKEMVIRSGRLSVRLDYGTRNVGLRPTGLRHLGNPSLHARNPITHFGGMLDVVIVVDEFI